ncbi:MAG TPA: hypothetical protein PKA93_10260 [Arachnia sp.]|nr:hypothetical protein [Arachnia sp.]
MLPGFGAIGPITLSGVGVAIGVAVTAPERRYLATLGLTAPEARTILERADRTGTPEEREAKDVRAFKAWRLVGWISLALLVVAGLYVLMTGFESRDENDPGQESGFALFSVAALTAVVTAVLTPTAFIIASTKRPASYLLEKYAHLLPKEDDEES